MQDLRTTEAPITAQWRNLTLVNNWENYDNNWSHARVKRVGDIVYVEGLIKKGDNRSTVTTLPVDCRPSKSKKFITTTAGGQHTLNVYKNGNIDFSNMVTQNWQSIEISFAV